jgi:hypothetical protein
VHPTTQEPKPIHVSIIISKSFYHFINYTSSIVGGRDSHVKLDVFAIKQQQKTEEFDLCEQTLSIAWVESP